MTPEKLKEYRKGLRAKGICTRCHKRKPEEGYIVCERCKQKTLKRREEHREDPYKCNECGHHKGEFDLLAGRARCPRCTEVDRIWKLKRRQG